MEILISAVIFITTGFFLGRGSIKLTYGGKIVTEVTDAGTKRFTLEIDTNIDDLDKKKSVIFKIVPPQDALL